MGRLAREIAESWTYKYRRLHLVSARLRTAIPAVTLSRQAAVAFLVPLDDGVATDRFAAEATSFASSIII